MWFEKRRYRITASVCGKILQRSTRAIAHEILYPKPFVFLPAPLLWGRKHEKAARKRHEEVKTAEVGSVVETHDCGLYVHPYHSWLAATPGATLSQQCRARQHPWSQMPLIWKGKIIPFSPAQPQTFKVNFVTETSNWKENTTTTI